MTLAVLNWSFWYVVFIVVFCVHLKGPDGTPRAVTWEWPSGGVVLPLECTWDSFLILLLQIHDPTQSQNWEPALATIRNLYTSTSRDLLQNIREPRVCAPPFPSPPSTFLLFPCSVKWKKGGPQQVAWRFWKRSLTGPGDLLLRSCPVRHKIRCNRERCWNFRSRMSKSSPTVQHIKSGSIPLVFINILGMKDTGDQWLQWTVSFVFFLFFFPCCCFHTAILFASLCLLKKWDSERLIARCKH